MTDNEIELFLTLKFSNLGEVVDAFKEAINAPVGYTVLGSSSNDIMDAIGEWVEQGAPKELEIPDDKVALFLNLKFGSLKKAYYYWQNNPDNNLSKAELNMVMDYVVLPE